MLHIYQGFDISIIQCVYAQSTEDQKNGSALRCKLFGVIHGIECSNLATGESSDNVE